MGLAAVAALARTIRKGPTGSGALKDKGLLSCVPGMMSCSNATRPKRQARKIHSSVTLDANIMAELGEQ